MKKQFINGVAAKVAIAQCDSQAVTLKSASEMLNEMNAEAATDVEGGVAPMDALRNLMVKISATADTYFKVANDSAAAIDQICRQELDIPSDKRVLIDVDRQEFGGLIISVRSD